jgi:multidrug efflux system membrane fusion protein
MPLALGSGYLMMKRVVYLVILLAAAGLFYVYAYPRLSGTSVANAQQTAPAAAGGRGGARGGAAVNVVTAVAQQQTVPITKSAVGYMEPAATVVVRARADGVVVQQDVQEGQDVRKGDLLFKLDDGALQATIAKDQAQIAKDQANAAAAQAALDRDKNLFNKQVVPQSTLDTDTAAAKAAQATVQIDQAQLRADQVELSYMTIAAPIDGRVGTVNTSVGNVVHASDTSTTGLLTITQMSPLRVSFTVAEGDLDSFRNALAKQQKLPVQVMAPGDQAPRATGTLSFIDSSVDSSSGTVVIKADVDNSGNKLWPGQYVTAVTQLGAYTNATTVPLVAVQQSSNGAFVYLVGPNEKVKTQPVSLTAAVNETAVIASGVKPGDHVVTEGQMRLSDGTAVREASQQQATGVATNQTAATNAGSAAGAAAPGGNVNAAGSHRKGGGTPSTGGSASGNS